MDAFDAVRLPESVTPASCKSFSITEANRALILVRRIVADVVRDYERLCVLHSACRASDASSDSHKATELRRKYAAVTDRLSGLHEELDKVGCVLKDHRQGAVDFPGQIDGHEVLLCWRLGDERIEHWHDDGICCSRRQPLLTETAPSGA